MRSPLFLKIHVWLQKHLWLWRRWVLPSSEGQGSPPAPGWWHVGPGGLVAGCLSGTRMAAVRVCFASLAQPWCLEAKVYGAASRW